LPHHIYHLANKTDYQFYWLDDKYDVAKSERGGFIFFEKIMFMDCHKTGIVNEGNNVYFLYWLDGAQTIPTKHVSRVCHRKTTTKNK
jgi:hypothetical protein